MHMLILEDEPLVAQLCGLQVQKHFATNGVALTYTCIGSFDRTRQWLNRQPAASLDLIVLDREVVFGHDGLDLIPELRQHPTTQAACGIIVWSSHDSSAAVELARAAGADAFISKDRSRTIGQAVYTVWQQLQQGASWITL